MIYKNLKASLNDLPKDGTALFALIRSISNFHSAPDTNRIDAVDLIIRLLSYREEIEVLLPGVGQLLDAMAREAGLFPYIKETTSWHDEYVLNLTTAPGLKGIHFHIEQARVFSHLAQGQSVILSAPTSFGKSLLIDALISLNKPQVVVACVPTIALLDEFRRRMKRNFPHYQLITSQIQIQESSKPRIFIGTQERLKERRDIRNVDLFVLDEFYKLDLSRGDDRALTLNSILSSIGRDAKQIYLLGPSIDEVEGSTKFRPDTEFIKTKYSPVAADIIDRTKAGPEPQILIKDLLAEKNASSLVYVKSPPASWRLADELTKSERFSGNTLLGEIGEWLGENYHPEWSLAKSLPAGIGIHHGRVPRSIAYLQIQLFNQEKLKRLICTSSMIEGVNTAAECVFIFDRQISNKKIDRFTFDNIKGRAGRLMRHNIGRIYLYNQPPDLDTYAVEVPLFGEESRYSDELLFSVEDKHLNDDSLRRKEVLSSNSSLPRELLEVWSEYGIDALERLAEVYSEDARDGNSQLAWRGYPEFDQLNRTFDVAWGVLKFAKHGLFTGRQATHFCNVLRRNAALRGYFDELVSGVNLEAQKDIDTCFNFLRGAEYTFPQILRCMNDVADAVIGVGKVDYRAYSQALQAYFLPPGIRTLDEFGIPIPIGRKLGISLDVDLDNPDGIISDIQSRQHPDLTTVEDRLLNLGIL